MSRTDAHAPFHVRVARREVAVIPDHRCADGGECDLPGLVPGWTDTRHRCRWQYTYTDAGVCSCWMCHWHSKPEQPRVAVRIALRAVARRWNGGDDDAAFEV